MRQESHDRRDSADRHHEQSCQYHSQLDNQVLFHRLHLGAHGIDFRIQPLFLFAHDFTHFGWWRGRNCLRPP
ncbi:MAG: hypothetical protein FD153_2106 [Rhodospirillaceae bacterium]|nr:MAG: hypothetical protein FD153_2106 [Rhodospirillaceae bacterium]